MKIDWGTGILITIIIFLIGMISLVIISSMQPLNLVSPDYYPKGINYQSQIDKKNRSRGLAEKLKFSQDAEYIYISFPDLETKNKPSGSILVYRPADNRYDKEFDIQLNDSLFHFIAKDKLFRGRCIIKVDWVSDTTTFYQEETMMLY